MTEYNATIEYNTRDDVDEQLLAAFADYHPATSRSSRGQAQVTITLSAHCVQEAEAVAMSVATAAIGAGVETIQVDTTAAFDERHGLGDVRDPVALRRIGRAQQWTEDAEAELRNAVQAARDEGETWAAIGRTLGTTRQAAQERFGRD